MPQTPFHAYYKARLLEQLPEAEQFLPVFASSDIEIYPFQIAAASFALRSPYQKGAVPVSYTHLDVYKRQVSIRIARCISPLPSTRKESVLSVSKTFRETSFSSSRNNLSLNWREVTYSPSVPAKGLSLTEKVISTVGSPTLTKGIGSIWSGCLLYTSRCV